ncbi:hypothetical protein CP49_31405 [Bradyrhizobium valentinum]|uniref:DUF2971 domain-containing protein n=1 Tax=Bradyrhizobium valentinum TaxID=1518501 RepID=A0A0R3LTI4_9BRAD|nr:hypothetical protein CP49_31405 [Bradyrhizobium valentinum]
MFHYTSAEGLVGILQTQSLFATHSAFLNDSTECRIIRDILLPRLESELREATPKLIERRVIDPKILTDFGDELFRQEADNMLHAMSQATNNTTPYFITSFCVHQPNTPAYSDGLLSQWRGYAKGGFAIEFDEIGIDDLNAAERTRYRYQGIITNTVAYNDHESRVSKKDFEGLGTALLKSLIPKIADRLTDILGPKTTNDFAGPFLATSPFLKHPSFEEENEYRIVALCNRPTVYEENDERDAKPIQFRSRATGQLIPYIALYHELKTVLPIKSIIIGPHPNQSERQMSVEILLEKIGVNVPIKISLIPFRD